MTPKEIYEAAPIDPVLRSRMARIPLVELEDLVSHHRVRRVGISTVHFGLADVSKGHVIWKLRDDYFKKRVAQLEERHDRDAEVTISLELIRDVKHEAYELHIFTIGVWSADGETVYVVS